MEANKIQYFEKIENPRQKAFVDDHSHCTLCGTVLDLQHVLRPEKPEIEEKAYCPKCDMKTRTREYPLN